MRIFIPFFLVLTAIFAYTAHADTPWEDSPVNWRNSPYNYENSPLNFLNSPKNHVNAEGHLGRLNIVNMIGSVTGYAIVKRDGGINYFDNDGVRIGYSNNGGITQYNIEGELTKFTIEVQK